MPLSPQVPDIRALDLLVSVARLGSLGRAAQEHGISQPAAASRVRHLEGLLGVSLIDRTPTGSRLTEDGATVVAWARDVLAAAATLDAGVDSLRMGHVARMTVAASLTVSEHLVPTWLVDLKVIHPGTAISLQVVNSAAVASGVLGGDVELGFVESPGLAPELDSTVVGRDSLVVVVFPAHPWAERGVITAAQLAAEPLVQREPGSGTRETLEAVLGSTHQPAPPAAELSSTAAVKAAVEAGLAPAVLSRLAVADDLRRGLLKEIGVEDADLSRELRAVWSRGRRLSPLARDPLAVAARPG